MLVITKGEAGGAQSHVLALCEALHTQVNFTVVIGGPTEDSVLGQQLHALGVRVCPLPAMVESMLPWRLWPAVQQLIALIEAHPPDLIHAHSAIAGLAARLACQRTARPVVYTVHGFGFKAQIPWLRRHLAALAERFLSGWTTQMICVSAFERALAHQLPIAPERVHVIPNGIARLNPPHALPQALPQTMPEAAASNTMPRLIMVARMKSPKRHDLLLRALAKVRDWLGHELPVTLAGDGPLLAQHQALAAQLGLQQITWTGDVGHVAELLVQHDLFVLLSDHEGMPITVLEAMRAGLPVLASDLPGLREQVMHGHEGLLVANTEQAVAHQLLRLAQDPALRQRLGLAAQARFERQFTLEDMAQRVMAVYQQCLNEDFATSRPNTTLGSALVSATVRRRDALQSWTLWGVWLLLPSLWLAQGLETLGWVTYQFADTLWWCALPYAVAAQLLMRASHLPLAERSGVLWVSTSAPFLCTPLGFALLQQPYSRAAVVWAYAVTTLWLWWGYRRKVSQRALHLVHLDANVPSQLAHCLQPQALDPHAITLQAWSVGANVALPACDGVVLDRQVPHTPERTRLLSQLKMQHLRLYSVEAVAELVSGRKMLPHAADSLWEIDNDPGYDRLKRFIDLSLVLLLAPLWLPLALAIAAAVRYDSAGPALYSQTRIGRYGQAFRLWKFRSMVHGASSPTSRFAQTDDPRITRVGQFIRRTRLDELPQLWNVLWGHMSLIGPRPEQAPFVRDFATSIPSYPYRHLVRPGLTGWAQVQHGYADSADSTRVKLSYDLYYVAHYSLALDLLIAMKTVRTVLTGFGAR
jgi:exopolysaccharide biosynthesis polyprenyl glycosylphosphotransferase